MDWRQIGKDWVLENYSEKDPEPDLQQWAYIITWCQRGIVTQWDKAQSEVLLGLQEGMTEIMNQAALCCWVVCLWKDGDLHEDSTYQGYIDALGVAIKKKGILKFVERSGKTYIIHNFFTPEAYEKRIIIDIG